MARILGIDYGEARIGLALTDARNTMALPLTTVQGGKNAIANIKAALKGADIERIVIGLPLLLSGKDSPMSEKIRLFAKKIEEAFGLPVTLFDERLTSSYADTSLREMQLNRKERSQKMDTSAATILLQNYLDAKK